ncbi:MAG: cation:proton antiporter [Candidatus Nanopelagicales bacterium]|nr:cation:proton antiporter [Candidatus Nanopelagicales bacterium]
MPLTALATTPDPEATEATVELLAFLLFGVLVVAFVAITTMLRRHRVTAPIAFVAAGTVIALFVSPGEEQRWIGIRTVAEVTLVLLLFHDAAQVRPREIERDRLVMLRLLFIGLPLTVLLGYLTARWLFPDLPVMMALLLAAALAPTDAGLGAATVLNPVVPVRVRRLLNVESGLNDGLVTPVVLFAIAAVAGSEGLRVGVSLTSSALELVLGIAVGTGIGVAGGTVLGWSRRRGTSTPDGRALAVLLLPLLAYALALLVAGNGFVAAFVCGTSFAGAARWIQQEGSALHLTEALADPLGYVVWLVFGFVALRVVWGSVGVPELAFAVLALTVLRMGPVALSLMGSGLRWPTVLFIGWFGPRGLASVVFALIAVESLVSDAALDVVLGTISITVLGSVVAHGMSADPWSERFGAWVRRTRPAGELAGASEPRSRDGRIGATRTAAAPAPPGP